MSQLVVERSIKPRSRAKARAGLVALQRETHAQRQVTEEAATHVLGQLKGGTVTAFPDLVKSGAEHGFSRRRVVDAIYLLKGRGQVRLDVASSRVWLRPQNR